MRKIPDKHKTLISTDPFYRKCCLEFLGDCDGRITIEHALIHAGRQISEMFNYVPLCEFHHAVNKYQDGGDFHKDRSVWIALNRATDQEIKSISKAVDYFRMRNYLNEKYGKPPFMGGGS